MSKPIIGINDCLLKQLEVTQTSSCGGTTLNYEALCALVNEEGREDSYDFEKDTTEGFAPFVRILEIKPEHLQYFLQAVRPVKSGEVMTVTVEPRFPGEVAVPAVKIHGPKESPAAARLILYHKDQLESEGKRSTWDADWEIVAIICGPAEEPMNPYTLARNYLASREEFKDDPRAVGGSPQFKDMDDHEVLIRLIDAMFDWAPKGTATGTKLTN